MASTMGFPQGHACIQVAAAELLWGRGIVDLRPAAMFFELQCCPLQDDTVTYNKGLLTWEVSSWEIYHIVTHRFAVLFDESRT